MQIWATVLYRTADGVGHHARVRFHPDQNPQDLSRAEYLEIARNAQLTEHSQIVGIEVGRRCFFVMDLRQVHREPAARLFAPRP